MPDRSPEIRKRGRPEMSPEKKTEMRGRISETASDLFKTEGYSKVSMRRIAKEIGCTPMALYRYYDSKIEILRSLWGDVLTRLFQDLEALPAPTTPHVRLLDLGTAYVGYWLENPEYYRLVFMAEGVDQPDVSLFLGNPEIIEKYDIFSGAIRRSNNSKHSDEDIKVKLDFFLSALHGIAHNHITISGYPWSSPRKQIELAIRAVSGNL